MPEVTSDGADLSNGRDLTPEQRRELEKARRKDGGVAAGRALFEARHPKRSGR